MQLTVQRFTLLSFSVLLASLLSLFSYYYLSQREYTASVILKSIQSNLSETSYLVSKNISNKNEISSIRPLLDRVAANNEFVDVILIHDENKILISTDPFIKKIPSYHLLHNMQTTAYSQIINEEGIESDIKFYDGNQQYTLQLLFVLEKDSISSYFSEKQTMFIIYFIIIPIICIVLILYLMRHFILQPLESLRQFSYYQNEVPKAFLLKELEIIRYSMIQTFTRLEKEKEDLYLMSTTDSLSGLANRNALNEYFDRLLLNAKRKKQEFAFLFLDLDHFKSINDSLGHNIGDELLKHIATMIRKVIRPADFVARIGGDEFIILVQDYHSLLDLTTIIDRILEQLTKPWIIQTNPISISGSIGISLYPKNGEDMVSLMKNSDIAMYEAKKKGRARYSFFTEELNTNVQHIIELNNEIKQALVNNEYELYYQPKIDVSTSQIIGAEALIRWNHPTKGMIPPDVFIPLAEENNFIIELGRWIMAEAIGEQTRLKAKGIDIVMSINISAKQILEKDFFHGFTTIMQEYGANPKDIDIEITEYMFLEQSKNNSIILNALHDYGVSISLDDFGTGYSSLSYLKLFPINNLKIDKAFMDDFDTHQGAIFLDTIVKMGQNLNMTIIAEGIESQKQLEYLSKIGCNQYQGYYFSKPLAINDFEKLHTKVIS
ncbi:MAG: diguanylate cyclase (GGDEF)-like protein [Sulfurimonas sp.]|jgi:diguanylate cyclase (GGDEF)-like protein|uniref:putative bifunctional diguanylate cyclase/phosphodiesterase n=1 Tax=Sulfurimonas sp. TaxID=2022749 RepID=UPI0039E64168